jgi:hypothetical protein
VIVAIERVVVVATSVFGHDALPISNRIVEEAEIDPFALVGV